jgi:hypothetical protein
MAVAPSDWPGACAVAWLRARCVPAVGRNHEQLVEWSAGTAATPVKLSDSCSGRVADGKNLVPNFVPDSANITLAKPA